MDLKLIECGLLLPFLLCSSFLFSFCTSTLLYRQVGVLPSLVPLNIWQHFLYVASEKMAAFLGLPSCSLSDLFSPPLVIVEVIQSPETLHTSADVIVFQTLVPFCTAVLHHTQLYQCEESLYGDFGPALQLRNLQLGPVLRGLQGSCSACCRPAQQSLAHPVIQNPQVAFLPGIRL